MSQVKMSLGQNVRGQNFPAPFLNFWDLKNDQNFKYMPSKDDNEILMKIIRGVKLQDEIFVA